MKVTKAQRRVLEGLAPEGAHLDQARFRISKRRGRYDFFWEVRTNPRDLVGTLTPRKDTVAALLRHGWIRKCAHVGAWIITDAGRRALRDVTPGDAREEG